ncbi:MAG TPA: hypothetical protein VNU45_12750, partial [Rummeliibacillus sp.]|nr:hypothetical protein [Rummeliibacillus sp.]
YKAGRPVQIYVIHEKDINAFSSSYDTANLIKGIEDFINKVNKLSNTSQVSDITDVVSIYNKLNEAQLSVIEKGILTKYNIYAPIADIKTLADSVPVLAVGQRYGQSNIDSMLKAIAIYKKLSKDPKAIVTRDIVPSKSFLTNEDEIKAAQKVDKAFKALDKSDDKYLTNLNGVIKSYDALSTTAQKYVTSDIEKARQSTIYKNPISAAADFEKAVNDLLDKYPMTYWDVKDVVDKYNLLNSKAKSLVDSGILKTYNKYAPIVEIVNALFAITPVVIDSTSPTKDASIGYYKNQDLTKDVGSVILNAIQLFNKLGSDQKDIVINKVQPAKPGDPIPTKNPLSDKQIALLNETSNIKASQALDKKITAIKPKTSGYIKGIIDARKTLEVMPREQRVYLQNAGILNNYEVKPQTKKAIDDLATFENGVQLVDEWASNLSNDQNAMCTEGSTTSSCKDAINNKMKILATLFDQFNVSKIIDGSETKLAPLIDRAVLTRYQYLRAVYDVEDQIKNN